MREATLNNDMLNPEQAVPKLPIFWLAVGVSIVLHVVGMLWAYWRDVKVVTSPKPIEMVMVEVEPPKPPEPVKVEAPVKQEAPKPRVAKVDKPLPKPPPELKDVPPPPNDAPAPELNKPVPLITGISMSSTSAAGAVAAQVGNTMYGVTDKKAIDASQVKSYAADKYAPAYQVDAQPSVLSEYKAPYPEQANRAGVEGTVVLKLLIDAEGNVADAKLLRGLGFGLDEAALQAIRKFKFRPAMKGGENVATEINYNYTWLLD